MDAVLPEFAEDALALQTRERRRQRRVPMNLPADLDHEGRVYPVCVRNMSLFGAYIEAVGLNLPRGTFVELQVTLAEAEAVRLQAIVMHEETSGPVCGYGLRMHSLDRNTVLTLIHYLNMAAE